MLNSWCPLSLTQSNSKESFTETSQLALSLAVYEHILAFLTLFAQNQMVQYMEVGSGYWRFASACFVGKWPLGRYLLIQHSSDNVYK